MNGNPEFLRNLWLEFGASRVALVTVTLLLGFAVVWISADYTLGDAVANLALWVYAGATLAWGARAVSLSMVEEVRAGTWDTQKLSALEPWTMTWGKLFGASALAWYAGALCMAAYLAAGGANAHGLRTIVLGVAAAVLLHGTSLTLALVATRRGAPPRAGSTTVLLLLTGIVFVNALGGFAGEGRLRWYGADVRGANFLLLTTCAFAAWAVVAAWRLMCTELSVRTLPVAWLGFHVFLAAWGAGFDAVPGVAGTAGGAGLALSFAAVLCGAAFVLAWVGVLVEPRDPTVVSRWLAAWRARHWHRAAQETPLWVPSVLVALAASLVLAAGFAATGARDDLAGRAWQAAPAFAFLLVRDLAILHWFAWAPGARRPEFTTFAVLLLAWWLVPQVLKFIGLGVAAVLVLPPFGEAPFVAAIIAAAQAALALWLLARRWRALAPPAS